MGQISTLLTGAGVTTVIPNQDQLDSLMVIGDIDTACPLQGIAVELDGEPIFNVQNSQPLCSALMKYLQNLTASTVGLQFKFATGKIKKPTTYRLTNNGATTPAIYAYSDDTNGIPFIASSQSIVATSYAVIKDFTCLLISSSANINTIDFTWRNTNRNTLSVVETDSYFASKNQTEANGRLDPVVTGIDNRDGAIAEVQINTGATAVQVIKLKFNQLDFETLKAQGAFNINRN